MKFATIIRESGINIKNYDEQILNIPITLYDGKNRLVNHEEVHFVRPLFYDNLLSKQNFESMLYNGFFNHDIQNIDIMINETYVVLFYDSCHPIILSRKNCMDFYDYMQ